MAMSACLSIDTESKKTDGSSSLEVSSKAADSNITFRLTASTKPTDARCRVIRVYPTTNDDKATYSTPASRRMNDYCYTGPPLGPHYQSDSSNLETLPIPEGSPVRGFFFEASTNKRRNVYENNFGTCRCMGWHSLTKEPEFSEEQRQGTDPTAHLHRELSWSEWVSQLFSPAGKRHQGVIREQKGWSPGWCGYMSVNGLGPWEVADTARTVHWLSRHQGGWRLQRSDSGDNDLLLICCNEEGSTMCELRYRVGLPDGCTDRYKGCEEPTADAGFGCAEDCKSTGAPTANDVESRTTEAYAGTFTWLDLAARAEECDQFHDCFRRTEAMLFEGLVLAEKLRRRRLGVARRLWW